MLRAQKSKFFERIWGFYNRRLLRKHYYRIHISGESFLSEMDSSLPILIYANHSNWWDGLIGFELITQRWKKDGYVMMDIKQMSKYKFFRKLGAFSVDRDNAGEAVESINYAVDLLKETNRILLIFPQGEMLPNDIRPLKFYSGAAKIIQKLEKINLIPMAMKFEFMMEQRPEIFIRIGKPEIINEKIDDAKLFTEEMKKVLTDELDELKDDVLNNNLNGYKIIFEGKKSRNKEMDNMLGRE